MLSEEVDSKRWWKEAWPYFGRSRDLGRLSELEEHKQLLKAYRKELIVTEQSFEASKQVPM